MHLEVPRTILFYAELRLMWLRPADFFVANFDDELTYRIQVVRKFYGAL